MLNLTEKEWCCFNNYLKEFIEHFEEDDSFTISDGELSYTRIELLNLQKKIDSLIMRSKSLI